MSSQLSRVLTAAVAVFATVIVLAAAHGTAEAEAENRGPATTTIDRIPGGKSTPFPHHAHFDRATCLQCHHTGKNIACAGAECHGQKTGASGRLDLKAAFHKQCIPCHAKSKATVKCAGPGCHPTP